MIFNINMYQIYMSNMCRICKSVDMASNWQGNLRFLKRTENQNRDFTEEFIFLIHLIIYLFYHNFTY